MCVQNLADTVQVVPPSAFAVLPTSASRHSFFDGLADIYGNDDLNLSALRKGKPFVAHDQSFLQLLSSSPDLRIIARQPGTAFAHEAGIYLPDKDEVWFTSNLVRAGNDVEVHISKIHLADSRLERIAVPHVGMGNGGCLYRGKLLFCEQGSMSGPSQLVLADPLQPSDSFPLLDNFHGRRFNSINDVIALPHPHDSTRTTIWFTDPTYGYEQGYRPKPELPSQVYCFDPDTGDIRAVADGFDHPNGICFSPDGQTCYITDTCHIHGTGVIDPAKTSTIYAFDVVWCGKGPSAVPQLRNRRLFAFADSGVPDGIKCDVLGNVYAGCGDGIHVWSMAKSNAALTKTGAHGKLIGKIIFSLGSDKLKGGCANFCFVPGGRMICLAEDTIYLVEGLAVEGDRL